MWKDSNKFYLLLGFVIAAALPFIGRLNHHTYGLAIGISLGLFIAFIVAWIFTTVFFKLGKYNKTFLQVLFWSNMIAWIVPMLGYFISISTSEINRRNRGDDKRLYFFLSGLGLTLSLVHVIAKVTNLVTW